MNALATSPFPYRQSYWMLDQEFETAPPLVGAHEADVVIVGGGFAGLSTALGLIEKKPGLRVTVIEARHVGYGASGRNGGKVMNFPPATWLLEDLSRPENVDRIALARELATSQLDLIARSLSEAGIDAEIQACRIRAVARNALESAGVHWVRDLLGRAGIETTLYTGEAAQERSFTPARAVLAMPTTSIQPFKLAQGLRAVLLARGVTFFEDTPATRVEDTAAGVRVTTPKGEIRAHRAVLTTNAYILQHTVALDQPLPKTSVLHTYVIATERLPQDKLDRIFPDGEGFGDASVTFYYGCLHDGRLLFGGVDRASRNTPADDRREASFRTLQAEMVSRFPFLAGAPLYAAWGGAVQETRDTAPIMRRASAGSNIILNMGFGGNSGVNGSLLSGRLVPALVLDDDDADAHRILKLTEEGRIPWVGMARAGAGLLAALFRS